LGELIEVIYSKIIKSEFEDSHTIGVNENGYCTYYIIRQMTAKIQVNLYKVTTLVQ